MKHNQESVKTECLFHSRSYEWRATAEGSGSSSPSCINRRSGSSSQLDGDRFLKNEPGEAGKGRGRGKTRKAKGINLQCRSKPFEPALIMRVSFYCTSTRGHESPGTDSGFKIGGRGRTGRTRPRSRRRWGRAAPHLSTLPPRDPGAPGCAFSRLPPPARARAFPPPSPRRERSPAPSG